MGVSSVEARAVAAWSPLLVRWIHPVPPVESAQTGNDVKSRGARHQIRIARFSQRPTPGAGWMPERVLLRGTRRTSGPRIRQSRGRRGRRGRDLVPVRRAVDPRQEGVDAAVGPLQHGDPVLLGQRADGRDLRDVDDEARGNVGRLV